MENLQGVGLFTHAQELDRHPGDCPDRDGRAAAGVAIHLGQDQPRQTYALVKLVGHAHSILAGHGIDDQQHFLGSVRALTFSSSVIISSLMCSRPAVSNRTTLWAASRACLSALAQICGGETLVPSLWTGMSNWRPNTSSWVTAAGR